MFLSLASKNSLYSLLSPALGPQAMQNTTTVEACPQWRPLIHEQGVAKNERKKERGIQEPISLVLLDMLSCVLGPTSFSFQYLPEVYWATNPWMKLFISKGFLTSLRESSNDQITSKHCYTNPKRDRALCCGLKYFSKWSSSFNIGPALYLLLRKPKVLFLLLPLTTLTMLLT